MKACTLLVKIRSEIDRLAQRQSVPTRIEYELDNKNKLGIYLEKDGERSLLLRVVGPYGPQEANLDDFDKVIGTTVLYAGGQLSSWLMEQKPEQCRERNHEAAHEMLALFQALVKMQEKQSIPFVYEHNGDSKPYKLLSVTKEEGESKITLIIRHLRPKEVSHVTVIEPTDRPFERANQLVVFELMAWLTPGSLKEATNDATARRRMPAWVLPAAIGGILSAGLLSGVWLSFNDDEHTGKNWKKLSEQAHRLYMDGNVKEGLKLYHRAYLQAEKANATPDEKFRLQRQITEFTFEGAPFNVYEQEMLKLIFLAQLYYDEQDVEALFFEAAKHEFEEGHYLEAANNLRPLITIAKHNRPKEFAGFPYAYSLLGRCYAKLGENELAEEAFNTALKESQHLPDKNTDPAIMSAVGYAYQTLGELAEKRKDYQAARNNYQESLKIWDKLLESKEELEINARAFLELNPKADLKRLEQQRMEKLIKSRFVTPMAE